MYYFPRDERDLFQIEVSLIAILKLITQLLFSALQAEINLKQKIFVRSFSYKNLCVKVLEKRKYPEISFCSIKVMDY